MFPYAKVYEHVMKANVTVSEMRRNIQTAYHGMVQDASALGEAHRQQSFICGDMMKGLHGQIKDIREVEIMQILGAFAQMHMRLVSTMIRWKKIIVAHGLILAIDQ